MYQKKALIQTNVGGCDKKKSVFNVEQSQRHSMFQFSLSVCHIFPLCYLNQIQYSSDTDIIRKFYLNSFFFVCRTKTRLFLLF